MFRTSRPLPFVLGLTCLALAPVGARAQERFGDINDTLMHYYLTSAYNVRSDLQRAKEFALRYDLPNLVTFGADSGVARERSERVGFFLTFRGDKLYEGGGELDGGVDYLNVAYEFLMEDSDFSFDAHVGVALIEHRLLGQELGAKYLNILGGFDVAVGDDLTLGADLSFNLATPPGSSTAEGGDFDQLSTYLDIPSLGAFGSFRYDLGSRVPRDAEVGYAFNLEARRRGILRFAYAQRFKYEITGTFFRNRYQEAGLPNRVLDADSSGIVRWDRVGPFGSSAAALLLSGGLALGTVPGLLRYAFGEANLQFDGWWGAYARAGAAYGRVQDETVAGYSAGIELLLYEGTIIARAGLGRRDWEVVDRVGSADRTALMIFIGGGWSSDAPPPRRHRDE